MDHLLALPAPAKLNLFLHVTGRRDDGYHTLETALQLIDLADWIDLERRADGAIVREGDLTGPASDDLAVRAAHALKRATGCPLGATIRVRKNIPVGGGMGGGSSDAATTLLGLNRLWNLALARDALADLAQQLGADVPFFVRGFNAYARGIGEQLWPVTIPPAHYAIVWPQVHVSTKEIFADASLTPTAKATKIADFAAATARFPRSLFGVNDLEVVARRRLPVIGDAIEHLRRFGDARMTGSGSAVFVATQSQSEARVAATALPGNWQHWVVQAISEHPLAAW
jgi:4-diphosphocytidyl-2-C-methyl-D-erythritol kinase